MWERPKGAPSWIGICFKSKRGALKDIEGIGYNVKGCQGCQEVHWGY
jgi:hypothetical protein